MRPAGVEPATYSSGGCRSIQLSYGRAEEERIVRDGTGAGNDAFRRGFVTALSRTGGRAAGSIGGMLAWIVLALLADADLAAIKRVDQAYVDGWRANDRAKVLAVFAKDAVIVPDGRAAIAGHEAMSAFWWPNAGRTTVTSFENKIAEVGGNGDFAFTRGTYAFTFDWENAGKVEKLANRGNYVMLFRRDKDGVWKITHRMWSDLPRR